MGYILGAYIVQRIQYVDENGKKRLVMGETMENTKAAMQFYAEHIDFSEVMLVITDQGTALAVMQPFFKHATFSWCGWHYWQNNKPKHSNLPPQCMQQMHD